MKNPFRLFKKPRQFVIKLEPYDGQYSNFFRYEFERVLETARLLERFQLGEESCVLLFEEIL